PRDYSKKVSKSVRRLAFRKALSERIKAGDVLMIDKFVVPELKTKSFLGLLKKQTDARKVLLVSDAFDQNTLKSGRNVKPVTLATASDENTEQLLCVYIGRGCKRDRFDIAPRFQSVLIKRIRDQQDFPGVCLFL